MNVQTSQHTSAVAEFIDNRLITGQTEEVSVARWTVRRTLQGLGMVPILVGRIGMAMICLRGSSVILGQKEGSKAALGLGIPSAVGAVVTFGLFSMFNTFSMISVLTKNPTPEEVAVTGKRIDPWKATAISATSVVVGLIAHIALAYAAYDAANFAPIIMYLGQQLDFGRAANSTYLTLIHYFTKGKVVVTGVEKLINTAGANLCSKIGAFKRQLAFNAENSLSRFNRLCPGKNDELIRLIERGDSVSIQGPPHVRYVDMVMNNSDEKVPAPKAMGAIPLNLCRVVSVFSALGIYSEFFGLGYAGGKAISKGNEGLAYTTATVVMLANAYIWGTLIYKCSKVCTNFVRRAIPKPVESYLSPKLHTGLTGFGFMLALPMFVPQMFFAKQYLPKYFYWPSGITSSIAGTLGGFATAIAMRDILVRFLHQNDPRIRLSEQLTRLSGLISQAQPDELAKFFMGLPIEIREKLACPSEEILGAYIQEKAVG